jgi:diguanylate cyclase (GGDEF)-like protein
VYAAALALAGTVGIPTLLVAGFLLALAVEALRWRGTPDDVAIVLFWAPLHLLIAATGSLASAALPLAAAWVVALGLKRASTGIVAAVAAGALLLLGSLATAEPIVIGDVLRLLLLLGLAAMLPRVLGPRAEEPVAEPRAGRRARSAVRERAAAAGTHAAAPPASLLALVRRATGASEAIVWEQNGTPDSLRPVAWSGTSDAEPPQPVASLRGHPYSWPLEEHRPVRVERGRKPLPRSSAAEMLLLPLAPGTRLLTLSYHASAPAMSEAAAVAAVEALDAIAAPRHAPAHGADATQVRLPSTGDEGFPITLEGFAAGFARTAADLIHAEGAALVLWSADGDRGRVIALAGLEPDIELPAAFRGSESHAAAVCASGRSARIDDALRTAPELPILVPGEVWEERPRSVLVRPIAGESGVIGAVLAWDTEPNHFHLRDEEAIDLLAGIAAPILQHTAREVDLTPPVIADDVIFQARLAGLCGRFHRYSRPFAVIALDLDHLAQINKAWGADVGSLAVHHLAALVRSALREVDLLARPDGGEFVLLLPETTLEAAMTVAERIRTAIEVTPFSAGSRRLTVTASLGVAACPDTCTVATDTLGEARDALRRSTQGGRNRVSAAAPRR